MADFDTLMDPTRQEPFTKALTSWDRFSTSLSLPSKQLLNSVMTGGAVFHALGIMGTWSTGPRVTNLGALVLTAVELLTANLFAGVLGRTAKCLDRVVATEACDQLQL